MRPWIKLYTEILHDPKMGRMPHRLFRRTIELFLLAGICSNNEGILPPVKDIAWHLRVGEASLLKDLMSLQKLDIVHEEEPGVWVVTHFAERQDADTPAERMARLRASRRSGNEDVAKRNDVCCEDVTKRNDVCYEGVTKSNVDKEVDKEVEAEVEKEAEAETKISAAVAAADFQSVVQEKHEKPFTPKPEREKQAEIGAVFREYEQNIGALTPLIADHISDLLEHYPRDWISAAFREAVAHEARNLKYVEAILRRWKTDGFQSSSKQNGKKPRDNPSRDNTSQPTPEEILADMEG